MQLQKQNKQSKTLFYSAIFGTLIALSVLILPIANNRYSFTRSIANAQVADPATYYGVALNAATIANTTLEGSRLYAKRVMFPRSGQIVSVRTYHMCASGGYCGGTGGTVKYELRADDGTASHLPSATVLGYADPVPGNIPPKFPLITFTAPITVQANTWYHLVAYNADPNPTVNFTSENDFWDGGGTGKIRIPLIPDMQFAVLYKNSGQAWATRKGYTAIADFTYSVGTHYGNGYMELSSTAGSDRGHMVSGVNKVREIFTYSPTTNASVSSLSVSLWRKSGTSPITTTLISSDGTVSADSNTAPLGGFGKSYESYNQDYIMFDFPTTLKTGITYRLELSAPSDTVYMVYGVRDGKAAGYGFGTETVFDDGWEQYNTGSGWVNWDTWGKHDKTQDLPFIFLRSREGVRPRRRVSRT